MEASILKYNSQYIIEAEHMGGGVKTVKIHIQIMYESIPDVPILPPGHPAAFDS